MTDLATLAWPRARIGEALQQLAGTAGLGARSVEVSSAPAGVDVDHAALARFVDATAAWVGVEAEPALVTHADVPDFVRGGAPALVETDAGVLALVGPVRGRLALHRLSRGVRVLAPDHRVHVVREADLVATLRRRVEAPHVQGVERLIEEAHVAPSRRRTARERILGERAGARWIGACWLLRATQGSSFARRLSAAGIPGLVAGIGAAHALENVLWILAWAMVGRGALEGRLDHGWLVAWGLVLLTIVPVRLASTWWQGRVALGVGGQLKQRFLAGAMRLEPEEVRTQGAGQLLGHVIDAEAVETLALSGGFLSIASMIEIALAVVVLALGAGGGAHATLLVAWTALALVLGRHFATRRRQWSAARIELTSALVEGMVGHRTRVAQESPKTWHEDEDQALARYVGLSAAMDRHGALLTALVPRGWLVLGLAALAPAFVRGHASPAELAVALGGVMLGMLSLKHLAAGMAQASGAWIAWRQVARLFAAAARPETAVPPGLVARETAPDVGSAAGTRERVAVLVEARDVTFAHAGRATRVLDGVNLRVREGDRILLEGASGSGKSTFASLLAGLRLPDTGLLLQRGLDPRTLGPREWRRHVTAAPQFHENHVLTGTLAFNLLMGRRWPASQAEIDEAEAACRELGLGDLIDRMPSGMLQAVGESGWRLSHGERSRVFMARALLQDADLVVLDESFAALDPITLRQALDCARRRARTLLVIAHP